MGVHLDSDRDDLDDNVVACPRRVEPYSCQSKLMLRR